MLPNKETFSLHCQTAITQKKTDSNNYYGRHDISTSDHTGLRTLPSLLRADQRNDPRQLGTLRKLLLLRLLVHVPARSNVVAYLEHAVL